jgi:hypothetical protein
VRFVGSSNFRGELVDGGLPHGSAEVITIGSIDDIEIGKERMNGIESHSVPGVNGEEA